MDAGIFQWMLQQVSGFFYALDAIKLIRVGDDGFSLLDLLIVDLLLDMIIGFLFGIKSKGDDD